MNIMGVIGRITPRREQQSPNFKTYHKPYQGVTTQMTPKIIERAFFEFLPFTHMKMCWQKLRKTPFRPF